MGKEEPVEEWTACAMHYPLSEEREHQGKSYSLQIGSFLPFPAICKANPPSSKTRNNLFNISIFIKKEKPAIKSHHGSTRWLSGKHHRFSREPINISTRKAQFESICSHFTFRPFTSAQSCETRNVISIPFFTQEGYAFSTQPFLIVINNINSFFFLVKFIKFP